MVGHLCYLFFFNFLFFILSFSLSSKCLASMAKSNKLKKPPRFYFWRKTLSLSDLNLPRRSKITVDALRTLSLFPSVLGWAYNWQQALQVPLRDAGGAVILQSSQLDYVVASFWVIEYNIALIFTLTK